ncbi:hypothetical protein Bca101_095466 [Brassica carinata]
MMRGVERVKEFLRPLVDSRDWDFCVIWKLGDDPSRFIEWVGCCCSGSYIDKNIKHENVEEEEEERQKMGSICRDEHNKHHIRSLACEALCRFPLFIPLYPGIHGEVVMSKSPKWLVNSGPGSKQDIFRTRVLVPVRDGLVELFSFTMMNKNGTLSDAVDYISELLVEKQKLEDELSGINEVECRAEEEAVIANPEAEKVSSKLNKNVNNEVNLEVHETGEGDFLIRVAQEHKQDGFKRLIEAVDSCGLEIINVNVTRLDLTVMTILNVKANKYGITREDLRDLLFKMIITSVAVSLSDLKMDLSSHGSVEQSEAFK